MKAVFCSGSSASNKAILKAKMPKDVEKKCLQELKKLKNMSPMSAEATVVRNYLDWMTELPWNKKRGFLVPAFFIICIIFPGKEPI